MYPPNRTPTPPSSSPITTAILLRRQAAVSSRHCRGLCFREAHAFNLISRNQALMIKTVKYQNVQLHRLTQFYRMQYLQYLKGYFTTACCLK